MIGRNLVKRIAGTLATDEGLIEKDWHVVRAIGVLVTLDHAGATPVFSGGTSLLKGWDLIKRFSEDIDFKVTMPPSATKSEGRRARKTYHRRVLPALTSNGFDLAGDPLVGNKSQFFAADFAYPSEFTARPGLRPHIRVEMSFYETALKSIARPIQSLPATAQRQTPEVTSFLCGPY